MKTIFLSFLVLFGNCIIAFGQKSNVSKIDSLTINSYENLENSFFNFEYDDPIKARLYADAYLKKAKDEKDSIQIARGYKYISFLYISKENIPEILKYSDSIILISKKSNHKSYPALGYHQKGIWLYQNGNYKKALDNYLIAQEYAFKQNNENQLRYIKLSIAALRNRFGEYDEALKIYIEELKTIENEKNNNKEDYFLALQNVANCYLRTINIDSSYYYMNKGLIESKSSKDSMYYEFLSSIGYVKFYQKRYNESIDSIKKAYKYRSSYAKSISCYYLSKSYDSLNKEKLAIDYLKKSDSIYQETKDIFPEIRNVYERLIDFYEENNNTQKQLHYINKLLVADSILDSDFKYISKNIIRKYDTSILIKQKEAVIEKLNNEGKVFQYIIFLLLVLTLLLLFYIKHRNKLYKKRFNELIEKSDSLTIKTNDVSTKALNENIDLGIPKNVVEIIVNKLNNFEKNKLYLNNDITLNKVADQMKTNSSYLSKIINTYKEKSFNHYINDLRIDYIVERLKNDKTFIKYSVKSIGEEAGYVNYQSFSNAFYRKTGIKPSYFIKELKKEK